MSPSSCARTESWKRRTARYEDFGVERLIEVCTTGRGFYTGELLARIFSAVHDFTNGVQQHDDMAATVFHFGY